MASRSDRSHFCRYTQQHQYTCRGLCLAYYSRERPRHVQACATPAELEALRATNPGALQADYLQTNCVEIQLTAEDIAVWLDLAAASGADVDDLREGEVFCAVKGNRLSCALL